MMKTGFFSLLLAASSASAFSPQDTTRRQFLGGVASTASTGIAVVLSQPLSALAADATPSFSGIFTDPNHPQGWRAVREENGVAILQLQDEPGAEIFTIKGDIKKGAGSETTIMLDLSPKGGPKDVPATVSEGKISFPDGNSWKRLDGVDGVYSDPNHPEGYRIVRKTAKDAVSVTLQDAPGAPVVTVIGSVSGDKIKLDLSPKGGPKDLVASIGANRITFPDGNSWPKL